MPFGDFVAHVAAGGVRLAGYGELDAVDAADLKRYGELASALMFAPLLTLAFFHTKHATQTSYRRAVGVRAKRIITTLPSMPKTLPRGARREFLMVYGKRNCPACGGAIEQNQIGNRKLYFCPSCQTGQC